MKKRKPKKCQRRLCKVERQLHKNLIEMAAEFLGCEPTGIAVDLALARVEILRQELGAEEGEDVLAVWDRTKKFTLLNQINSENTELAGYKVWVRHPLADEVELLAKLEIVPEDCKSVDIYLLVDELIFLISICSASVTTSQSAGFSTYTGCKDGTRRGSFYMVVADEMVTTDTTTKAVEAATKWIKENPKQVKSGRTVPCDSIS